MNYLSMCAVIRNEALYLPEWMDFYIKQGVEKFYLYNNESTDNFHEVIKPYQDKNLVMLHETRGLQQQGASYNHALATYRGETEWMCFFDVDEFCYAYNPVYPMTLKDMINDNFDVGEKSISGIAIHWLLFGSSGHEEYSSEGVLKRFTRRAAEVNPHVKSIMRMSDTYSMGRDPHSFYACGDIVDENGFGMEKDYALHPGGTADYLRINHYHTKSKAEYKLRRGLPDANSGVIKSFDDMWLAHDRNDVEDTRIQGWL